MLLFIEIFNEWISLNGVLILNDVIVELVLCIKLVSEMMECEIDLGVVIEFEIIIVMMFLYFGEIYFVDFVIVEVGLGIKNDLINVFILVLLILISIGLDYIDILGGIYLDIVRDKGVIIKFNVLVIYVVKNEDVLKYVCECVIE